MTMPAKSDERLIVGTMTGTSIDGLDIVLCRVTGHGLEADARLLQHAGSDLRGLNDRLRDVASQRAMPIGEIASLAWEFGHLHATRIDELLAGRSPDLIVVHGQTVFHEPPVSMQLINSAPIRHRFDCPVIDDLRQADLAAGGEGAPIMPLADHILFGRDETTRAIVNLGGFCNLTYLPGERSDTLAGIKGFDVCACNHVLDTLARDGLGRPFDEDGRAAASGVVHQEAADALKIVLTQQHTKQRSLGTGDEATGWVHEWLPQLTPADAAASAVSGVAACISGVINTLDVAQVVLCGGGARHAALVSRIETSTTASVALSDAFGIPIEAREAMGIAVLGALAEDGIPITLPQVTGRG